MATMMTRKEVDELLRICPSAREVLFSTGNLKDGLKVFKCVSVASRDEERLPGVAAILMMSNHAPLRKAGACWQGAVMWMQGRTWYQSTKAKLIHT
jgi:hypothetical protein